jgi:fructuronate reductase
MTGARRLSAETVAMARAAVLPGYDRSPPPRIAHIGVGAFARGHLGVYADELLRAGWPATVAGVSLRSRGAEDQLSPQDGLYTVEEPGSGPTGDLRVVGAFTRVRTGPGPAVEAIAGPQVELVTLTVTEKGYEVDPADLEDRVTARSPAAVVALGLARRRQTEARPPVVASLDNVAANGDVLRRAVMAVAGRIDRSLPGWIADHVAFPRSVVDRMVPAPTAEVVERISGRLGLVDRAAVSTERHRSWVIEAKAALPPLADAGVLVVADTAPFERRKLWLLNCPHSAVAYGGLLAGCRTIAEAVRYPEVIGFARRLVADIVAVCDLPPSLTPERFAREALERFANPALGHTCTQVGADGSRKLAQRLLPVVAARRRAGVGTARLAVVAAIWIAAASGVPVKGEPLPSIADPEGSVLRSAARRRDRRDLVNAAFGEGCDDAFVAEVSTALTSLERRGVSVLVEC